MWIETEKGELVHTETGATFWPNECEIRHAGECGEAQVATFKTPKQAQAAMDRLKKWLWSDGWIAESGVGQKESRKVFSFRTLSEDDEFKE